MAFACLLLLTDKAVGFILFKVAVLVLKLVIVGLNATTTPE